MLPFTVLSGTPPPVVLSPTGGPPLPLILLSALAAVVGVGGVLGGLSGALTLPLVYRDGGWLFHRRPSPGEPDSAPVKHLGAAAALGVPYVVLLFAVAIGLDNLGHVLPYRGLYVVVANVVTVALFGGAALLAYRMVGSDRGRLAGVRPPSSLARRHFVGYLFALLVVVSTLVVAFVLDLVSSTELLTIVAYGLGVGGVVGCIVGLATLPLASRGWGRLLARPGADGDDVNRLRHLAAGGILGAMYLGLAAVARQLVVPDRLAATLTSVHPAAAALLTLLLAACLLSAGLLFVRPALRNGGRTRSRGDHVRDGHGRDNHGSDYGQGPPMSRLEGLFVSVLAVLAALGVLVLQAV